MASSPITSWQIEGGSGSSGRFCFLRLQNHCRRWLKGRKAPWKESSGQPRQHVKKQRHHFTDKGSYSQSYGFPSSHVQMWELSPEKLVLSNCGVEEDSWEPLDEGERGEWKSWFKTQHSENYDHDIWFHHFMANRRGKKWKQWQILFS